MLEQRLLRRPGFKEGIEVRLCDGGRWTLPILEAPRDDPEFDALLKAVTEAEDGAELLRLELAITILFLGRNYELTPAQITELLSFPPGDPALEELQCEIHELVIRAIGWNPPKAGASPAG